MRVVLLILLTLAQAPSSADSQPLPHTQRVFMFTPQVLKSAKTMLEPVAPSAPKGSVVVAFWTSEQGAVVSARGIEGSAELQRVAIDAIYQWKFNLSVAASGQLLQMGSAVIVDFSKTPSAIAPKPMSAAQVSPDFQFKCFDGMVHEDPASVDVCRQQLAAIQDDSQSTPMDRFTALDQYGLVVMKYSHDPKKALELFSQAIGLAPERLKSSDSEWAYVHWHRASAEQQSGNNSDAEKDFAVAENSLQEVANGLKYEKSAAYYRALLASVAKQHAALLDPEKK